MSEAPHTIRYPFASALGVRDRRPHLALAEPGDDQGPRTLFEGRTTQGRRTAELLLTVGDVASARFCGPPAAPRLRDPIITSAPECIRFEAFSLCGSVYARADLDPGFFASATFGRGTNNVDMGAPFRAALRRLVPADELFLRVSSEQLEIEAAPGPAIERRVPLPKRWLRALAEAQAAQAAMQLVLEVPGPSAMDFIRRLPPQGVADAALEADGASLRLRPRGPGRILFGSTRSLRLLAGLDPRSVRIYATPEQDACAWQLDFGPARLVLVQSSDAARGFSGEGRSLADLALEPSSSAAAALYWSLSSGDPVPADGARSAAAWALLAEQGLVGFDLATGRYFDRRLPFDLSESGRAPARVASARAMLRAGAVTMDGAGAAVVHSGHAEYRVGLSANPPTCTCAWFARHRGARGPCKHVLAAQAARRSQP